MAGSILREMIGVNGSFARERAGVDLAERAAAQAALTEEAQANWDNPRWHHEQAALIAESLDYGLKNENVFGSYIPTQFVGEDEKITVRERRGLRVFYTHRAGEIDESVMRDEVWELPRDTLGWHVSEFEDDAKRKYGETISELVPFARQREEAEINRRIFQLAQEAVPASSPYYEDATANFDPTVLNSIIADVSDIAPPSNAVIHRAPTIVGRAAAINRIFDFPGFAPEAQEELRKTGRLGVYRGANIVKMTNWTDDDGDSYFPDDELFVFGGYVGKFAFYGGPKVKSYVENKTDFVHFRSRRDLGGAIWHPEAMRRVALTV